MLVSLSASAQSDIVVDFTSVCDSLSVLIKEKTGVDGNLKLKSITRRGSNLLYRKFRRFPMERWRSTLVQAQTS